MAATLAAVKGATEVLLGTGDLSIDNWTFKLFYQWSVTVLVTSSVLVSASQFFGDPIQCDMPGEAVGEKVLKSYCWMYSTFDIPKSYEGRCARKKPRLDPYADEEPVYNSYYQWVPIVLVFQAILFYLPRVMWLMLEGGLMKYLGKGATGRIVEESEDRLNQLIQVFKDNLQNRYNRYAMAFFGCEVLNVAIVVGNFFLTNVFLDNQFLLYGPNVLRFYSLPQEESDLQGLINPMCYVFPRVARCTFYKYGTGGRQNSHEALCILSLNIIIDKVYLVLWFWFVVVALLGIIRVLCRPVQFVSGTIRFHMMKIKMQRFFKSDENTATVKAYIKVCKIGDWFVLYQMSKNLNKRFFHEFIVALSKEVMGLTDVKTTPAEKKLVPYQSSGGDGDKECGKKGAADEGGFKILTAAEVKVKLEDQVTKAEEEKEKRKKRLFGDEEDDEEDDISRHKLPASRVLQHLRKDGKQFSSKFKKN